MFKFRLNDYLSPFRLMHWRRLLWKSQYYSPERLRALQWNLLSQILDHCFERVPYYRERFAAIGLKREDIRSIEDLSNIPVLSRETVFDTPEKLKADDFKKHRPVEQHTCGTTGIPLRVYWDRYSNVIELTCMWRHFSWSGYRLGRPFLDLRSRVIEDPKGYIWNWNCRALECSIDIMDRSNIEHYADLLRKYRIKLWRGHPSAIHDFCHLLQGAGITDVKPKYVYGAAESLLEYQRSYIKKWTGLPICDFYGLAEHVALITQCPQGGYHINSEYGFIEIVGEHGSPVKSGEEGRVIATGLHNKAFPLLRYDTLDYAIPSDRRCRCGRTLPLVEKLTGRIEDRVLNTEGRWVSNFDCLFYHIQGIRKAQIVQSVRNALDIYIVPAGDSQIKPEIRIREEFNKKFDGGMNITIHRVDDVPFRSSGKFKFVICNLDGEK